MRYITEDIFIFVIDTDIYAGHFERQMTAYITGKVGECEVGKEIADDYYVTKELEKYEDVFENILFYILDEYGTSRPCCINVDSNNKYNSVAIFFDEFPEDYILELLKNRAKSYNDYIDKKQKELGESSIYNYPKGGNILGFRLLYETTIQKELKILK